MIDLKFIRNNKELVQQNCLNRLAKINIDEVLELDQKIRDQETKIEKLRAERNAQSRTKPSPDVIQSMKRLGDEILKLEADLIVPASELKCLLLAIPNLTHPEVKISQDENDNPVIFTYGQPTKFDFPPLDHVEIAEKLDLIDFDRATKVSGAKFYYFKNDLALLEFALIQYALAIAVKRGFVPMTTPDLAQKKILEGLGFNPRGEATQIYNLENTDLSLIGTAEITLGGYHSDEILAEEELPKKYVAVSHCFRTEAGAYSKFSKGIFRVHQFTKIEMFQYTTPENSEQAHQEILEIEKEIFMGLNIPFRVVDHCTADLGCPSYRTYDLEAWMPGKPNKEGDLGDWAEITSTSNCTDYQARGLNIKYKTKAGKKDYLHTLNGTAIAVTRALIAIIENFQQAGGSIIIPEILKKYLPENTIFIKRSS